MLGAVLAAVASLRLDAAESPALAERGLGTSAPPPPAERLFFADFDDLDAHAELARGNAQSSLNRPLLPTREGGARRGVLTLAAGERCRYAADRNVRPEHGTLSAWVHVDAAATAGGPRRLLHVQSPGAAAFVLAVDTGTGPNALRVVLKQGSAPDRTTFVLEARVPWREADWRRIDVAWSSDRLALYLDGALADSIPLRDFAMPSLEHADLELLPGAGEGIALDEVTVWSRALTRAEVAAAFRAEKEKPLAAPLVVAPRLLAPLRVDGRLDPDEWAKAALVPVALDGTTAFASARFATAWLAWDGAALRVAFVSPSERGEAEAFVLRLATEAEPVREHAFRVTSAGVSYRGSAPATPGRFAQERSASRWAVEAELPLRDLAGPAGSPNGTWRLRLEREAAGGETVGWSAGGSSAWGLLRLGTDAEGVRVVAAPGLAWGRPAFEIEGAPSWRARLRAEPFEGKAVERNWRLRDETPASPELPGAGGVLRLSVRDDEGEERLAWSVRSLRDGLLELPLIPDPVGGRLGVEIRTQDFAPRWRERIASRGVDVAITATAPDGSRSEARVPLADGTAVYFVPSKLAPGLHRLSHRFVTPDARLLYEVEREVEVPELAWATARAGETDAVLEPWTALRYEGEAAAEVWGRRYRFDGPLLAAVENQGRPLLRAPMRLELETPAGRAAFRSSTSQLVRQTPALGEWRGTGALGESGVRVEWNVTLEFDGFVLTSLALEPPPGGVEVRRLGLEIPLRSDVVRYLRGTHEGPSIHTGRVPWNGRLWQGGFEPFVWVTNEEEGFLYVSDSEANWVHRGGSPVVQVSGGEDAGIRLDLLQGPLRLDRRVEYRLGFEATPVKPMLPGARGWNFGNLALAPGQNALSWVIGWATHDGVFEPAAPRKLAAFDRDWRNRGITPFYFGSSSATPTPGAGFRLFQDVWRSAYATSFAWENPKTEFRPALPPQRMAGVCPAAGSLHDMLVHQAERLVREQGVAGLYTDTDGVFADDNGLHGCGFEDAFGRRGWTFGILRKRSYARRLASVARLAGAGRAYWMTHAHAELVPPVHGFADFWHPGEELTVPAAKNPWLYVDGLDPTAWRVEYRGESSGIAHVLLPELPAPQDPAATEGLLAMAAVNDVNVAAAFTDRETVGRYWKLRKELGLLDAEFVGHWRQDCPVRVAAGAATASAYRTAQGWVLVVANPRPGEQTIRLALDAERIGRAASEAKDARSGHELPIRAGQLELVLPARSYTYLTLGG